MLWRGQDKGGRWAAKGSDEVGGSLGGCYLRRLGARGITYCRQRADAGILGGFPDEGMRKAPPVQHMRDAVRMPSAQHFPISLWCEGVCKAALVKFRAGRIVPSDFFLTV